MPRYKEPHAPLPQCHPDKKFRARGLCTTCYAREYAQKHPHTTKQRRLEQTARDLGLTQQEVEQLIWVCEICGLSGEWGTLHLDHDHVTGKFRGILCGDCNRGIGCLKDDPNLMRLAALYIEKANG